MRIEPLSTCERNFIRECILINKRVDGRSSDEFRKFDISISESDGIIIAMLGKTKVSAQINSHTFQPRPHHPQNGSLHIDVDMSPMASPNHDNRLLGRRGLELTSFLEALYRDSECIDFESLCIKEGE
uniref:Exoribonuclease phosphorolytic domain-containing protein n=1 Tax=Acrobeloides nanus TaxID=290746 RepID=A0A914DI33_9BILA